MPSIQISQEQADALARGEDVTLEPKLTHIVVRWDGATFAAYGGVAFGAGQRLRCRRAVKVFSPYDNPVGWERDCNVFEGPEWTWVQVTPLTQSR